MYHLNRCIRISLYYIPYVTLDNNYKVKIQWINSAHLIGDSSWSSPIMACTIRAPTHPQTPWIGSSHPRAVFSGSTPPLTTLRVLAKSCSNSTVLMLVLVADLWTLQTVSSSSKHPSTSRTSFRTTSKRATRTSSNTTTIASRSNSDQAYEWGKSRRCRCSLIARRSTVVVTATSSCLGKWTTRA